MVVENGSALFHYYQCLPSTGLSSSSSWITPTALHSRSFHSNTYVSNVRCTVNLENASCSQSRNMFVCQQSQKRKAAPDRMQHRRSNPAMVLLTADTHVLPVSTTPVCSDFVVEIVALSSKESVVIVNTIDMPAGATICKDKGKLLVIEEVDDYSDEEFVPEKIAKLPKKNYDTTRKFQDT